MPVEIANPRERSHARMVSAKMGRLFNRNTGEFVHLSGGSVTKDIDQSWLGYRQQSVTVLDRACKSGQPFEGFALYNRSMFDRTGRIITDGEAKGKDT